MINTMKLLLKLFEGKDKFDYKVINENFSKIDDSFAEINDEIANHKNDKNNPHGITKSQLGLDNVENKSSSTIRNEITKSNVTTALGYTPINQSSKGIANGVAELDSAGKVPSSQLPSYVDDVIEGKLSTFPATGETGKIYVDTSTNKTYRWSGSTYTEISASLALGETSSTAYRGDRGKTAYDHSQITSGNPHGVTKSHVGLGNVPNVNTNDQTPTYTTASTLANLISGEKLSAAFGKIAKAIASLITHLADSVIHITSTERTKWNGYETAINEINSDLPKLLWTNTNPQPITTQNIPIENLNEYDYVEIHVNFAYDSNYGGYSRVLKGRGVTIHAIASYDSSNSIVRIFEFDEINNQIKVGEGKNKSGGTTETYCIPYKIYGGKYH